jgi:hypothetical protein
MKTARHTDIHFGLLGTALIALAAAFAVWGIPPLPPAPMVGLGIASPLTGMTRSFVALARGDVARSFWFHPLGPLTFLACIAAAVNATVVTARGRRVPVVGRIFATRTAGWTIAAAFLVVWVRQIIVFQ